MICFGSKMAPGYFKSFVVFLLMSHFEIKYYSYTFQ
jgi:hypothetical protein